MTSKREYNCALCNRRLPHERWIFSAFTKARYCWPGECKHDKRKAKKATTEAATISTASGQVALAI